MARWLKNSLWIVDCGVRRMNEDHLPGWGIPMFLFSLLGIGIFASLAVGLQIDLIFAIITPLDLIVTTHVLNVHVRRLYRMGVRGPSRARWWFELAAADFTLCMSCGTFALGHGRNVAMAPWQETVLQVCAETAYQLAVPFYLLTLTGFVLGLIQQRRLRGQSLELASGFFWMSIAVYIPCRWLPENPILTDFIAPVCAAIGVLVGFAAAVIGLHSFVRRDS